MTAYQGSVPSTTTESLTCDLRGLYERFLDWWATLYVEVPPRPYL